MQLNVKFEILIDYQNINIYRTLKLKKKISNKYLHTGTFKKPNKDVMLVWSGYVSMEWLC